LFLLFLRLSLHVSSSGAPDSVFFHHFGEVPPHPPHPVGVFVHPVGIFVHPVGVFVHPVGVFVHPVGVFVHPVGVFVHPVGVFVHPVGVFVHPVGVFVHPVGVFIEFVYALINGTTKSKFIFKLGLFHSFQYSLLTHIIILSTSIHWCRLAPNVFIKSLRQVSIDIDLFAMSNTSFIRFSSFVDVNPIFYNFIK
jgi:hypothetical protein